MPGDSALLGHCGGVGIDTWNSLSQRLHQVWRKIDIAYVSLGRVTSSVFDLHYEILRTSVRVLEVRLGRHQVSRRSAACSSGPATHLMLVSKRMRGEICPSFLLLHFQGILKDSFEG
jgi:hypothetical protein